MLLVIPTIILPIITYKWPKKFFQGFNFKIKNNIVYNITFILVLTLLIYTQIIYIII